MSAKKEPWTKGWWLWILTPILIGLAWKYRVVLLELKVFKKLMAQ